MYCDNCGAENRESANFCHKCRQSLTHIAAGEKAAVGFAPEPFSLAQAAGQSAADHFDNVLNGRYEMKDMLGRGGMGVVFRAHDRQLGMDVAIKFLPERLANDFSAIESLKREARAAMRLSHPNIIRLYNFEDAADVKYLLMEFIRGESLASIASRKPNKRFTEPEVIRYISEVCEALKYAHAENVVHRDIKPSNILVTNDGRVKITDFGVAHIVETASGRMDGDVAGTPSYMSPEQILGQPVDGRSDIYSLGVTMYEMLAGHPPVRGRDISHQSLNVMPEPVREVSDWMNAIILKCLRREPDGRWATAAELKDVLTGKQEFGVAIKSKYQPWWVVAKEERKMEESMKSSPSPLQSSLDTPKTPVPLASKNRKETPPFKHPPVHMDTPPIHRELPPIQRPPSFSRTPHSFQYTERTTERRVNLSARVPEREQIRLAFGTLGGAATGLLLVSILRYSPWSISNDLLLQCSLLAYGGLIGLTSAIGQKRSMLGLFLLAFGIMGGVAALLLMNLMGGTETFTTIRPSYHGMLYGALIGAFLGMADGVYERSVSYFIRCMFSGALGGAIGAGVFLVARFLFSAFWSPLPNWMVIGASLGFFINMGINFVEKPKIKDLFF